MYVMEIGVTESGCSVNVVHDSRTVNQDTIDVVDAIDCLYVPLRYDAVTVQVTVIYISVYIGSIDFAGVMFDPLLESLADRVDVGCLGQ